MCFLPLQQDFYSECRHASPQNSSQIYAYACDRCYGPLKTFTVKCLFTDAVVTTRRSRQKRSRHRPNPTCHTPTSTRYSALVMRRQRRTATNRCNSISCSNCFTRATPSPHTLNLSRLHKLAYINTAELVDNTGVAIFTGNHLPHQVFRFIFPDLFEAVH